MCLHKQSSSYMLTWLTIPKFQCCDEIVRSHQTSFQWDGWVFTRVHKDANTSIWKLADLNKRKHRVSIIYQVNSFIFEGLKSNKKDFITLLSTTRTPSWRTLWYSREWILQRLLFIVCTPPQNNGVLSYNNRLVQNSFLFLHIYLF